MKPVYFGNSYTQSPSKGPAYVDIVYGCERKQADRNPTFIQSTIELSLQGLHGGKRTGKMIQTSLMSVIRDLQTQ